MPGRRMAVIALLTGGAGLLAVLTLSWGPRNASGQGDRSVVDERVADLMRQGKAGALDDGGRQELLKRLLALGRRNEAQLLLEASNGGPRSLNERLLLLDLQRRNGDHNAAQQGLNQLLRLHPSHPDVLSQQVLLQTKTSSAKAALQAMEQRFKTATAGQRVDLGLLWADGMRRIGKPDDAGKLYQELAKESPKDARPLMAHALLLKERGQHDQVLVQLEAARRREEAAGRPTERIDELAASWGISAARIKALQATQEPSRTP